MNDPFDDPSFGRAVDEALARDLDTGVLRGINPLDFDPVQDAFERLDDPQFANQVENQFQADTFADRVDQPPPPADLKQGRAPPAEDLSGLDTKHARPPKKRVRFAPEDKKEEKKRKRKRKPARPAGRPRAPPPPLPAAPGRVPFDYRMPPPVHAGSRRMTAAQLNLAQHVIPDLPDEP